MDSEREPLNSESLKPQKYIDLEHDNHSSSSQDPQTAEEQHVYFNQVNQKVLWTKLIVVVFLLGLLYLTLAFLYGFWISLTMLIDLFMLAATYFSTISYKSLIKEEISSQKRLFLAVATKRIKNFNHGLTEEQLAQCLEDKYYCKPSSYSLPSGTGSLLNKDTGLYAKFPQKISMFFKPVILTFACLLVISWVPLRLLILTNFICKFFIFYFFLDVWNFCFKGHLGNFLSNGHGFSTQRANSMKSQRVVWISCIILTCLLAIGAVWSGIKLAFEAIYFVTWVISIFAKGFVGLFKRQKKLI